jgi:hypothetical protein
MKCEDGMREKGKPNQTKAKYKYKIAAGKGSPKAEPSLPANVVG